MYTHTYTHTCTYTFQHHPSARAVSSFHAPFNSERVCFLCTCLLFPLARATHDARCFSIGFYLAGQVLQSALTTPACNPRP